MNVNVTYAVVWMHSRPHKLAPSRSIVYIAHQIAVGVARATEFVLTHMHILWQTEKRLEPFFQREVENSLQVYMHDTKRVSKLYIYIYVY